MMLRRWIDILVAMALSMGLGALTCHGEWIIDGVNQGSTVVVAGDGVISVNSQTGVVVLTAADVGAVATNDVAYTQTVARAAAALLQSDYDWYRDEGVLRLNTEIAGSVDLGAGEMSAGIFTGVGSGLAGIPASAIDDPPWLEAYTRSIVAAGSNVTVQVTTNGAEVTYTVNAETDGDVALWSTHSTVSDVHFDDHHIIAGDDLKTTLAGDEKEAFRIHKESHSWPTLQQGATTYGRQYQRISRWFNGAEWNDSIIRAEFGPCPEMNAIVYCPYADSDTTHLPPAERTYYPLKFVSMPGKADWHGYYSVALTIATNGNVVVGGDLDMQGWSILNLGAESITMTDGRVISSQTVAEWERSADRVRQTETGGLSVGLVAVLGWMSRILKKRTGVDLLKHVKKAVCWIEGGTT